MNQNDFNNMTTDRLETLICCQRESTELEVMLVKRLLDDQKSIANAEYEESQMSDSLCEAYSEVCTLRKLM